MNGIVLKRCMNGWMDGWAVDRLMDGWMVLVDGWMSGYRENGRKSMMPT